MFNFTIIIPHKNIPNLLQRCLDSIPVRDDLQIIIVDDNSDPNIVNFKNFPGCKKANTEVLFTKEGRGAGYARNIGLKHAKGKWILFADADDVFESGFEDILIQISNDNYSDLVNFDVTARFINTGKPDKVYYHCNEEKYTKEPNLFKFVSPVPWGKAIRRKFIQDNGFLFDEVKFCNDLYFASLCDHFCQHRRIVPIIGYCWMHRENSLCNQENIECAEIRFYTLIKTAYRMRHLQEFNYAKRLIIQSYEFCIKIRKYSLIKHLKAVFYFALASKSLRAIFVTIPHILVLDIISIFKKQKR